MAKRRHRAGRRPTPLLGPLVLLLVLVGGASLGWRWYEQRAARPADESVRDTRAAVERDPATVDPAYDGRHVRLHGDLKAATGPRDTQLGVGADAAVLFRDVRMLQWQEHCSGNDCRYAAEWSAQAVDSSTFRHPEGHANPPLPFAPARFDATGLHLGAYAIDPAVVAAQGTPAAHAVTVADLPPNLAAAFHIVDGALVAGGEAEQPRVGTIRISYRAIAAGPVTLTGVQRGERLAAQ